MPDDSLQPFLFSKEAIEIRETAEKKGVYTGERYLETHPHEYWLIVSMRALNVSEREIARRISASGATCDRKTVAAVCDREPEKIDIERQRRIRALRRGHDLQLDRLIEHPDLVPMQFAGQVAMQLHQMAEAMEGRATSIVAHVEPVRYDNWEEFIEKQLDSDHVVELPNPVGPKNGSQTGLAGGKTLALGSGAGGTVVSQLLAVSDPAADSESDGQTTPHEGDPRDATANATDRPPESQASGGPGGRGGDAHDRAAAVGPMGNATRKFLGSTPDPS